MEFYTVRNLSGDMSQSIIEQTVLEHLLQSIISKLDNTRYFMGMWYSRATLQKEGFIGNNAKSNWDKEEKVDTQERRKKSWDAIRLRK